VHEAAGFIKGWLDARGIDSVQEECRGLPVIRAESGDGGGNTVVLHGHLDVVPAEEGQFEPRVEGDRLIGRGAYDMKAALAAMMLAMPVPGEELPGLKVRLGIVSDEESEESANRGSDFLVESGLTGDFAITGEPTDMHVGVAAKGVLGLRVGVSGRSAHGSTPWLGDNAILRAVEMFRAIESLPFAAESSELFDHPSISLGRIWGGDALNKVPDYCAIDVDIRFLPHQRPEQIREEIRGLGPAGMEDIIVLPPIDPETDSPWIRSLVEVAGSRHRGPTLPVGRDGASDAVSFIRAGMPAVEFGPTGADHHGPGEWVSIASLETYLLTLKDFLAASANPTDVTRDD
jgi:succinyl-diaminopimelate desuccinylase